MGRRDAKVDANQADIVRALTAAGATVLSLAPIGKGCPDLLVAYGAPVAMFLLEVKNKAGKNKVNEAQKNWHADWLAPVHVVLNPEQALRAIGAIA